MNRKLLAAIGLMLVSLALLGARNSNAALHGTNFRVNTFTPQRQMKAATAVAPDGSYVIVFASEDNDFQFDVFARLYDSAGAPLGDPFIVNQTRADDLVRPDVGMDAEGNFVVVWDSHETIWARRFTSTGSPLSDEYQVNKYGGYQLHSPAVAVDFDGTYAVTWTVLASQSLPQGAEVAFRRFDAGGLPLTDEFTANTYTDSGQGYSRIAYDGDFIVVTWTSHGQDGDDWGVYGRVFRANGSPVTAEIRINETVIGAQSDSDVALNDMGIFVVAWQSANTDGDGMGVMVRAFNHLGVARSGETLVNQEAYRWQADPSISVADEDRFLVAWSGYTLLDADDGAVVGIYARWLGENGLPLGAQFRVDTCYDDHDFWEPDVGANAHAPAEKWVIAWHGYAAASCPDAAPSGDGPDVYAQFGRPPVREVRYISLDRHGVVNGVRFSPADILRFDVASGMWSAFFDASDLGIRRNLSAFDFADDGSLFLVFDAPQNRVADVGRLDPHQVYRFRPAYSYGDKTSGRLELYFDGSDVGLTRGSERIDALSVEPDGSLLISTVASVSVGALQAYDEDLLRFTPQTLGDNTTGTWSLAFDGSQSGVWRDLVAAWEDPEDSDLYLAYETRMWLDGERVQPSTVLRCVQQAGVCDWSTYWRAEDDGLLTKFGIDALAIRRP